MDNSINESSKSVKKFDIKKLDFQSIDSYMNDLLFKN